MPLRTNHPCDILRVQRIRNHRLSGDSLPKAHQKGDQKAEPKGYQQGKEEDQPRASACCLPACLQVDRGAASFLFTH